MQRRKVYRVAAAYIIAAGFIIQIGSAVFPAWELPNWTLRLVVVLLLAGFPVALILAWAYDVTPQGIQATPPAPGAHRRRNIIALTAIGLAISAVAGFFLFPRASGRSVEKSIAVLPFQSLSDEKENAYFADGMQDDILTNLSKIGDLKVISRMSVMSYRGDALRNACEIGKALGVGALLEGSVRRVGNRVRVSVQLINANNDEHIWAEDYDRDLTDVFAIQTDLAQKIASALQAKLSPNEKERLDRRPTQDSDAYLLYIQAHNYANRPDRLRESSLKAEELFEQAIKLDPKFAAAFAGLSMVQSWMYHESEPTPARREKARLNANEALRLQPDLPEGHLALGYSYYYGDRDYERALAEFEIAKRDLPNEADAYVAIAAIQRRQGKWAESNANFEKAASLDPKNANVLFNFGFNYWAQRDFQTADKILDRAIAADPQSVGAHGMKSALAIAWKGDVTFAENQLSLVPPGFDPDGLVTSARVWVLTLQRKFAEALQMTQQFRGETLTYPEKGRCPKALLEGSLYPAFFALWLAIGIVVGDRTNFPIPLESRRGVSGLVALIPFATAVIALFASKNLRVINAATPSAWLIAIQTYRIAGIMFVFPFLTYGIIPAGFAYPAGIGDALTGIFAPIVALIVARNRPNAFMWALAWNLFGTLDLIVAPATALYFQARVLNIYPLALVPLFLGPPLGILTHILSLRNLAVARTAVPVKA